MLDYSIRCLDTTKMVVMMKEYSARVAERRYTLKFTFNCNIINDQDTPKSLNMSDSEIIEVAKAGKG
jgi:hypothetical protein